MYVYIFAHELRCPQSLGEAKYLGAGVSGCCEQPDASTGNLSQVFCKSRKHIELRDISLAQSRVSRTQKFMRLFKLAMIFLFDFFCIRCPLSFTLSPFTVISPHGSQFAYCTCVFLFKAKTFFQCSLCYLIDASMLVE